MLHIKKLLNDLTNFNNPDNTIDNVENTRITEFKYISLDGTICSIKHYQNPILQKFLYYTDNRDLLAERGEEPQNPNDLLIIQDNPQSTEQRMNQHPI